ncbi:hypothetical protein ACFQHV_15610 [Promicromonospora thailandica]|uniref:Uncharacterized protein n=1 Tax=Promicromonospora thailandica TaxID=765201 RepID=A0A9X2JV23_9MICO|nr:hypothetical protein [Promicromonospora thailandica]MCP2264601.1 hypothetical protein [Promicromonospora thailandica]BFF20330.1 hypothetical protein GCM10025730_38510 [Promicromonospora thailandica]
MESTAGLTAVALFVLWLGYWMPSLVRRRSELGDSRVADRFSVGLRIVAMSGTDRKGGAMVTDGKPRGTGQGVPRVAHPTPKGYPLQIMVRGRPLTAERIRRVERRARRAARARRRLIVSAFLLVCSVVAWALVGLGTVHWGVAATSTAMLLFVLFLGRRAARAARRADARWQATVRAARQRATQARALANGGPYAPRNRAQVTGLATHGSSTETQAIPRVTRKDVLDEILDGPSEPKVIEVPAEPEPAPEEPAASAEEPSSGRAWDPVPVPLPTYVTKPAAPQRQPAALPPSIPVPTPSPAAAAKDDDGAPGDLAAEDELLRGEPPRMKSETLATPLEEILARRRAAG